MRSNRLLAKDRCNGKLSPWDYKGIGCLEWPFPAFLGRPWAFLSITSTQYRKWPVFKHILKK
jgi:hypothetical protein